MNGWNVSKAGVVEDFSREAVAVDGDQANQQEAEVFRGGADSDFN